MPHRIASDAMLRTVAERYEALVAAGVIERDPAQRLLVEKLDVLNEKLGEVRLASKKSALGWMFMKRAPKPDSVRGLYVFGKVGRGKTMLMDWFFDLSPVRRKRRVHFHEFMAEVQDRLHKAREDIKAGRLKDGDPIGPVAEAIARETRLLCFDEFSVTNIADAMVLGRLFTRLFAEGTVVVATSNVAPVDLYSGGLNRELFLPFIDILARHVEIVELMARADFRLEKLEGAPVYLVGAGAATDQLTQDAFKRLTGVKKGLPHEIDVKGRKVLVPQAAHGIARFDFMDLCERPLGASDYLKIAQDFHTVFIERIPVMGEARRNEAKRFINLIDALYDNRVKLIASAAAEPSALYTATDGTEAFEFQRTISRLTEMRSVEWLALPHGAPTRLAAATSPTTSSSEAA